MSMFDHNGIQTFRDKTNASLVLDHRHKHCACGARITDKQKHQQDGCCSKCFAEKRAAK